MSADLQQMDSLSSYQHFPPQVTSQEEAAHTIGDLQIVELVFHCQVAGEEAAAAAEEEEAEEEVEEAEVAAVVE